MRPQLLFSPKYYDTLYPYKISKMSLEEKSTYIRSYYLKDIELINGTVRQSHRKLQQANFTLWDQGTVGLFAYAILNTNDEEVREMATDILQEFYDWVDAITKIREKHMRSRDKS